jgi:hypothetical protein
MDGRSWWHRALRPIEQQEPTRNVRTPDNTSTESLQHGSQNSFETRKQRAVTIPVADTPVSPLIPGRTLPSSAIRTGVESGTWQGSTSVASAVATVENSVPPPAVLPHSGAGQLKGYFPISLVAPNVQQVPAVTGDQSTIVHNTHSDRTPFQVHRRHSD